MGAAALRRDLAVLAASLGQAVYAIPLLVTLGGSHLATLPLTPTTLVAFLPAAALLIAGSAAIWGAWRSTPGLVWPASALFAVLWLRAGLADAPLFLIAPTLLFAAAALLVTSAGE